jgi:hypothetical protein
MRNTSKPIWALVLGLSFSFQLSGCSQISLGPSGLKNKRHMLLTDSVPLPTQQQTPANRSNQQHGPVNLSGQWRLGFQVENRALSSTLNLVQKGAEFRGEGIDDQTKRHFTVEGGKISGAQVSFFKRYDGNDMQPVEHSGQFSILNDNSANVHGPYLAGDYSTGYHGKILTGAWEAAMVPPDKAVALSTPAAPEPQPASEPQAQAQSQPGKAPDLSGKWNVGFEANFKTIHSVMYLEQDGGKLTGHGMDRETKEKFFIAKGWYHFPQVTIIRTYIKGKNGKASRSMTFKAQVNYVNDRDYQGPYLNGKTQGGGTWEAEMIK